MLDRIAAALMDTAAAPNFRAVWADQPEDIKTHWRFAARAAILAMRERTPVMERAALHAYDDAVDGRITTDHPLEAAWEAALDAALAEVSNG